MEDNIKLQKQMLRREIRAQKQLFLPEELSRFSEEICLKLEQSSQWQESQTILLYYALADEVQTQGLLERWGVRKRLLLPVVTGDSLVLKVFKPKDSMQTNTWKIAEPSSEVPIFEDYEAIDLAIIPGMAFDEAGHRLGRGKGYYDRLLPHLSCPTIGLCFPFQKRKKIPTDTWDIPVGWVF